MKYRLIVEEKENEIIIFQKKKNIREFLHFLGLYTLYSLIGRAIRLSKGYPKEVAWEVFYYNLPILFFLLMIWGFRSSKEELTLGKDAWKIRRFFFGYCFYERNLSYESIQNIYWEDESKEAMYVLLPVVFERNLKIRYKIGKYEDRLYSFGVNLSLEDVEKVKKIFGRFMGEG